MQLGKYTFIILRLIASLTACTTLTNSSDETLQASGVVEAVEVVVSPELGGRIVEILVDEGDQVQAGDALFRLEDDTIQAQRQGVITAMETAQAQLNLVSAGATPEDIAAAEAVVTSAQGAVAAAETALAQAEINADSARIVEQTESSVAMAEAALAQADGQLALAEAGVAQAQAELARLLAGPRPEEIAIYQGLLNQAQAQYLYVEDIHTELIENDLLGRPEERARYQSESALGARDAAQAQLNLALAGATPEEIAIARAGVSAAEAQVAIAQAGVDAAKAALTQATGTPETIQDQVALADSGVASAQLQVDIAKGQLTQAEAQRDRLLAGATSEEIAVLEAQMAQAASELALIDIQMDKLTVYTAVSGIIMTRNIELGEVIQPGLTALTIGQLDKMTITVFIPEDRYGQISLNDPAQVMVDSFPDETFAAVVTRIADQAEFTPRNVQTAEERRTTVFAIELSVNDPETKLKPGMPADVDFGAS